MEAAQRGLRLDLGIFGKTGMNVFGGLIQDFTGGDGVSPCLVWVRHLEHAGHELGDALGSLSLAVGTIALFRDASRLHGHDCRERRPHAGGMHQR